MKDSALKEEGSPIPAGSRSDFPGLRYFPPNASLVFDMRLARLGRPEPVEIAATGGEIRKARRLGYFRFEVGGVSCSLAAYELAEDSGVLFIPFRDATNGVESYEAGRYIEIPATGNDGLFRVDFNYAYNPFCAYNDSYSCPRVPSENVLPVSIPAGEMTPPKGYSSDH